MYDHDSKFLFNTKPLFYTDLKKKIAIFIYISTKFENFTKRNPPDAREMLLKTEAWSWRSEELEGVNVEVSLLQAIL